MRSIAMQVLARGRVRGDRGTAMQCRLHFMWFLKIDLQRLDSSQSVLAD